MVGMGDRDQPARALLQRAAAQVRRAVLGDDHVDVAARGRHRMAVQRRDDARVLARPASWRETR